MCAHFPVVYNFRTFYNHFTLNWQRSELTASTVKKRCGYYLQNESKYSNKWKEQLPTVGGASFSPRNNVMVIHTHVLTVDDVTHCNC